MGLTINAIYDQSVTSASNASQIESAINAAVQFYERTISNNITVNIAFGYGEIGNGQATVGSNALAEAEPIGGSTMSFAALKTALAQSAASTDDHRALASLTSDPTGGGSFYLPGAEEKALGLAPANATAIDGYVGISDAVSFAWTAAARGTSMLYDAIGALEHEIAHVLGRDAGLQIDGPNQYSVLDLFRYSAPGQHQTVDLVPAYFSVNGGKTNLNPFDSTGGDDGDWASSVQGDSFGYGAAGETGLVTRTDLREMDVLGYTLNLPTDTAAQLVSAYAAAPKTAYASISDTAANFASQLNSLEALAVPSIGAIYSTTLTDAKTNSVHVSAGQLSTDALALATINAPYSLTVQVSGTTIATAAARVQSATFTGNGSIAYTGNALNDAFFVDNGGSDTITGVSASNSVSYAGLTHGITANITNGAGTVVKGSASVTDHLTGIQAIFGSSGNDVLHFTGNGSVHGGAGNDTITVTDLLSTDTNYLYGGGGNNVLSTGRMGTHYEFGGAGQDTFNTGGGTTTINLGTGLETVHLGGAGNIATSATVYVKNFVAAHDSIDLSAIGATATIVTSMVTVTDVALGAELSAMVGGKSEIMILEGISASSIDLHGADFIL